MQLDTVRYICFNTEQPYNKDYKYMYLDKRQSDKISGSNEEMIIYVPRLVIY